MSRAVANTLLPAARPASTIARPRPRELPVTNHTCAIHPPLSNHPRIFWKSFSNFGNVSSSPVSSLLQLRPLIGIWLALHHYQKHHTDNDKHSECLFLAIPHFRLPHQKPFAPDI